MKIILVDAVDTFVIEGQGIYQPLYDLLEKYSNLKIIVSNANDEQMVMWGLVNLPYEFFTLKHSPDKTDPEYFKQLLTKFNLRPKNVLYFEHNPEAVKSAESVGIVSYYYDPVKKDLESLVKFFSNNLGN